MRNWLFGKGQAKGDDSKTSSFIESQISEQTANGEEDDELDEFFDCINETEESIDVTFAEESKQELGNDEQPPERTGNRIRDRTSFTLNFNIRELSLTLGKINSKNKIEGIQVYNKHLSVVMKAPTMHFK